MATYEISERLEQLARKVIENNANLQHLDDPDCRIAYQYSDQEKKRGLKKVYAETEKVNERHKAFIHFDFIVTFYRPNTELLTEEKMEKLMYHELRHVGFDGPGKYSIIPHDIEDFHDVIDRWGLDWI